MCQNKIRIYTLLSIVILVCLLASCSYKKRLSAEDIEVHPYYTSNMVFQSGMPIMLSGTCSPNGKLAVLIENASKVIEADQEGEWNVSFPRLDFKGCFTIRVEGKNGVEVMLENLTTGSLWLVIGDNWMPYSEECFANHEQSGSFNEDVRYFQPDIKPTKFNLEGSIWKTVSPGTIYKQEKLARALGERLQEHYNTPVGIINLSWPGTHIIDFIDHPPKEYLKPKGISLDRFYHVYDSVNRIQKYINDSSFKGLEKGVLEIRMEDWDWNDLILPEKAGKKWYLKDRIVWLRRKFYVSDKYRTGDFTIDLGTIRGGFVFYVNGVEIDRFEGEAIDYNLTIPDTILRTWTNLLTIRMNTSDSLSGFYSDKILITNPDSTYKVNINEEWAYNGYLERRIPQKKMFLWAYPRIYRNFLPQIRQGNISGLIVAGGANMYRNCSAAQISEGLDNLNKYFYTDTKLMCLSPKISFVDSMEQRNYFLNILNAQLYASAHSGYKLINLSDIEIVEQGNYSITEITERILERIKE